MSKHEACSCHNHEHHEHPAHRHNCACERDHKHGSGCACGHDHVHEEKCACGHDHGHADGCGCGHDHGHADGCGCGHDHGDDLAAVRQLPRLLSALVLFALGMLLPLSAAGKTALLLACYLVSGYDVLISAVRSLGRRRMLDEHFLMAAASLAAMAIGEMTEGCAVMLFYQLGEMCQSAAVGRSRRRIKALMELRPEEAFVLRGGEFIRVHPADIHVGEEIRVRPGERVPLDAVVLSGVSEMDTSALTGESVPKNAEPGDRILAGFVAIGGVVTAQVEKPLAESSVSRILAMVEEAQARKAPAERFITTFARVYTPAVVAIAVLLALVPSVITGGWRVWIYRALTFLVASCPCALVVSVPLCYFAGIGAAARRGILIKGGDSLDALCRVKQFVFDKTGTLTTGAFDVCHVHPAAGHTEEDVVSLIAGAERDSLHPLALAAVRAAKQRGVEPAKLTLEREIAGRGVLCRDQSGAAVLAGNAALMIENGVTVEESACDADCARIAVSRGGELVGFICLQDVIRLGAKEALAQLEKLGIEKTVMLTGDREASARAAAQALGVSQVHAQLLPQDKLQILEKICARSAAAFVGDGINDAPAIIRANVGIAMGALGSDAAIEAADIVLMTDEIERLPQAVRIAARVRGIARQNVIIALGIKIAVLLLAALGMAGMWAAVFADVGVALICVFNAMRAMR